jgi:hypothetical protein
MPGQRATSPWFNVTLNAAGGAAFVAAGLAVAFAHASASEVNRSVRKTGIGFPNDELLASLHCTRGTQAERTAADQPLKNVL